MSDLPGQCPSRLTLGSHVLLKVLLGSYTDVLSSKATLAVNLGPGTALPVSSGQWGCLHKILVECNLSHNN